MADRPTDEAPTASSSSRSGQAKKAASKKAAAPKAASSGTGEQKKVDPKTGEQKAEPRSRGSERFAAAVAKTKDAAGAGSTKVKQAASSSGERPAKGGTTAKLGGPRRIRRARLRLTHVDPWSVMKTAFLLSIAIGIVTIVAVGIVWSVLGAAGVWDSIDRSVADVAGDTGTTFAIQDYLGTSRVMGVTMLLAVVDVFLLTVIATLGAFLYNLAAALLGGLEVVFAEEER